MKTKEKAPSVSVTKDCDNRFAEIIKDINKTLFVDEQINLKTVQRGTNVSYPVLLDLHNKMRDNFNERTLSDITNYLNSLGKYPKQITNDFLMKRKVK